MVDAECQLPTEAQEGALCIVHRPEHHIGRDALFVRDSSKWRFRCCGTIPETTVYKGEVTRMSDLPIEPEIGDVYKVGGRVSAPDPQPGISPTLFFHPPEVCAAVAFFRLCHV